MGTIVKKYESSNMPLARNLRKNMTMQERKLWFEFLRNYPLKFYRQRTIGNYIVDFYCSDAHLVVELDGSQHYEDSGVEYDQKRSEYLASLGLNVLRFSNYDVNTNFCGVCQTIDVKCGGKLGEW